jgi:lysozyme|tara:strand:+ start:498 stop:902 length:405 start_codon:yes stop_codon:yes gene_type:complete
MEDLKEQLVRHEGLRLTVYDCPAGYKTIGVGRNLEGKGITEEEALYLLGNDINYFTEQLRDNLGWFDDIPEAKQKVLINMAFNLGVGGLMNFKNMLSAVEEERWGDAATEMLDSKWAKQVGNRAIELSGTMAGG